MSEAIDNTHEEDIIEEPRVRTPEEIEALQEAAARFEVSLTKRSFSGRNPELGPMIKCHLCGRRHRDSEKHSESVKYTKVNEGGRPSANPFGWRAKPGKMMWIPGLKKFVTINR